MFVTGSNSLKGDAKVNAGAVYPYDVIKSITRGLSAKEINHLKKHFKAGYKIWSSR